MLNVGLNRRGLLKGAALLGGAIASAGALSACSGGSKGSGKQVFVRSPGGSKQEALQKTVWGPFKKKTGIEVVPVTLSSAQVMGMVKAKDGGVDVLDLGASAARTVANAGGLIKLDTSRFTDFSVDDIAYKTDFALANTVYAEVLVYNSDEVGTAPTSWAEFWDVDAFPGRRAMIDATTGDAPLEQALLADGVDIADLYPLDLDRAFAKLEEIKPDVLKFITSATEIESLLSSGQVQLAHTWDSRIKLLMDQGVPLELEWNQAGRNYQVQGIYSEAENVDNAYAYINYLLQPEVSAAYAIEYPQGPGNTKAFDHIDDESAQYMANYPAHIDKGFDIDLDCWGENLDTVITRWQQFLAA